MRLSERILAMEIKAVNTQIIRVQKSGTDQAIKNSEVKALIKILNELTKDLDFLCRYRSYLEKESELWGS